MTTKAHYFNRLSKNASVSNYDNTLVFDDAGEINFSSLSIISIFFFTFHEERQVYISSKDVHTAAILYAISQREKKIVGEGDFNGKNIITSLLQHMSPAIKNKEQVAYEIYQSWHNLSRKLSLEGDTPTSVTTPKKTLPQLAPIVHFPNLVNDVARKLFDALASQVQEFKEDASQYQQQTIQYSLKLTYTRRPIDEAVKANQIYLYYFKNALEYALRDKAGRLMRVSLQSDFDDINSELKSIVNDSEGYELQVTHTHIPENTEIEPHKLYLYLVDDTETRCVFIDKEGRIRGLRLNIQKLSSPETFFLMLKDPAKKITHSQKQELSQMLARINIKLTKTLTNLQERAFFIEAAKENFSSAKFPKPNLLITAASPLLISIVQSLNVLMGNSLGKTMHVKPTIRELLFQLDRHFVVHSNKNQSEKWTQLQEQIQKELVIVTGDWLSNLKIYFDFEFKTVPKDCKKAALEMAFNNLLQGQFNNYCEDSSVSDFLEPFIPVLQMNKNTIDSFILREGDLKTIKVNLFHCGVHYVLRHIARDLEIELSPDTTLQLDINPAALLNIRPHQYGFHSFAATINHLLQPFNININSAYIFEHTLLKLAGITEFPFDCKISSHNDTPATCYPFYCEYFHIKLGISAHSLKKLTNYLNQTYGDGTALILQTKKSSFQMRLKTMLEAVLPDWNKVLITTFLKNPRILEAYQVSCAKAVIPLKQCLNFAENLLAPYPIKETSKAGVFEILLLRAFGIKDIPLLGAKFSSFERIDAILDIDFSLAISAKNAKALVAAINKQFPHAAQIIHLDTSSSIAARQHFAIDKKVFISDGFQLHLKKTLEYLISHDNDFVEANLRQEKPVEKQEISSFSNENTFFNIEAKEPEKKKRFERSGCVLS